MTIIYILCFFFFQAEDGIRDVAVTGVQTCALPILLDLAERFLGSAAGRLSPGSAPPGRAGPGGRPAGSGSTIATRSEERRVGKECRDRLVGWRGMEEDRKGEVVDDVGGSSV